MFRSDKKQTDPITEIEQAIQDIPESHITPVKAQPYAVKFNRLKATAARIAMDLKDQHGDTKVQSKLLKKKAYHESKGKTVEEKRLDKDCNEEYLKSAKEEESLEAKINYVETLAEVCGNYHIYFRQLADK